MARRRIGWGWWAGGGAAVAAGAGAAWLALRNRGHGAVTTTAPVPVLRAVGSLAGSPGQPVSGTLTFASPTPHATAAQSVAVTVTLDDGAGLTASLSATVSVPAIAAGHTALVPLHTTGTIPASWTASPIGVAVTAGAATVSGSLAFTVATPASFEFDEASLGSVSANVGSTVDVSVTVKNTGTEAATPAFSGGISVGGSQVAAWQTTSSVPSVAGGASEPVQLQLALPADLTAATDPVSLTVTP